MWRPSLLERNSQWILRAGFYCPSIFFDLYKEVTACYECQIFDGKRTLLLFPLTTILVEAPFQQWGLDFMEKLIPVIFVNTNGS